MSIEHLYATPFVACYEGEEVIPPTPPVTPEPPKAPEPPKDPKGGAFTQEDVNRFLAEEKRKWQEKVTAMDSTISEVMSAKTMTEDQAKTLEAQLDDVRKQFRTKEQQLAYEKKELDERYTRDLSEAKAAEARWQGLYTESTIEQALQSAAMKHDAYNPTQIVTQLRNTTKLVPELEGGKQTGRYVPMVDIVIKNEETQQTEVAQMTPAEAVEHMKKFPKEWGNMFRPNVVEGIGANSTPGSAPGRGLDLKNLSDEQYFKLRKENPDLIGRYRQGR